MEGAIAGDGPDLLGSYAGVEMEETDVSEDNPAEAITAS
jgi:hypothetical protein